MYVTVGELREYASSIGATLPSDDAECLVLLVKASRFIDSLDGKLKGKRTEPTQPHAYPRRDLTIYGSLWPSDSVPQLVKDCQMAFALEVNEGIDISGAMVELPVIRERVDVLETQYAAPTNGQLQARQSAAMNLLRQLMRAPTISVPIVRV